MSSDGMGSDGLGFSRPTSDKLRGLCVWGRISGFVFKCKNILLSGRAGNPNSDAVAPSAPVGPLFRFSPLFPSSRFQWHHVVAVVGACHQLWTADAVKCKCVWMWMWYPSSFVLRPVWTRVCYQLVGCWAVSAVNAFSRCPAGHLAAVSKSRTRTERTLDPKVAPRHSLKLMQYSYYLVCLVCSILFYLIWF